MLMMIMMMMMMVMVMMMMMMMALPALCIVTSQATTAQQALVKGFLSPATIK